MYNLSILLSRESLGKDFVECLKHLAKKLCLVCLVVVVCESQAIHAFSLIYTFKKTNWPSQHTYMKLNVTSIIKNNNKIEISIWSDKVKVDMLLPAGAI